MNANQKRAKLKRILALKEQIKTADEAICGLLNELGTDPNRAEQVTLAGKTYGVRSIFENGNATWRPARVHQFEIHEIKAEKA